MMRCIVATLDDQDCDADLTTRSERRRIRRYADNLNESRRTIFRHRLNGMPPRQIGKEMGMDFKQVCRELASIYAELRIQLYD